MGEMLDAALKTSLKLTPNGCCTCLCCRADKMNLLVKALEDSLKFAEHQLDFGADLPPSLPALVRNIKIALHGVVGGVTRD